jgi:hypothetical protein
MAILHERCELRFVIKAGCEADRKQFPSYPIRHGNKFWAWIHWHIEIDSAHFVRAESLTVRCFNVFKNTQPQTPVWNLMGIFGIL